MRRKPKKVVNYVMFGFNRNDIQDTGYLGKPVKTDGRIRFPIVQDVNDAFLFPDKNVNKTKGFGTPEQWLDFWNTDEDNNFTFHLVKTTL